jgi:hypothetical protein
MVRGVTMGDRAKTVAKYFQARSIRYRSRAGKWPAVGSGAPFDPFGPGLGKRAGMGLLRGGGGGSLGILRRRSRGGQDGANERVF